MKISYSQIDCYLTCPKQYEYRYIQKIPFTPQKAASFGSCLHNTLQTFYERIQETQQTQTLFAEDLPDISLESLLDLYEKKWISAGFMNKTEEDQKKEEGRKILTEFYKKHENNFGSPLLIEKGFRLHIDGAIITGRFDRVDTLEGNTVEIIDYKSGKIRLQESVDTDLQLSLYHLAAEQCYALSVSKLSLYFLKENLKIETTRSAEDLENAKNTIKTVVQSIKDKNFEATPSKKVCGCCDFNRQCPFAMV